MSSPERTWPVRVPAVLALLSAALLSGAGASAAGGQETETIQRPARTTRRPEPPIPPRRPPRRGALAGHDVLLIVLDAARADAFSTWGAPRPTPVVDALAASGTRVERAVSNSAWTAPAIGSLWTGLHPHAHGLDDWDTPLPAVVARLPEAFRDAGYATQLWSSHTLYRANRSLRAGFERTHLLRVAERDWLPTGRALGGDDRARLNVVHLLVPHAPYAPPPPFAESYAGGGEGFDLGASALRALARRPGVSPDHPVVRAARDRYDEMIAWADNQVGRVLAALDASGRSDRTLVVLTSDHGEAFLEHGLMLHTRDLHDEMVRVPLVFRWPAAAALAHPPTVPGPASLVDVTATLVDLFRLPWRSRIHGRSLAPASSVAGSARPVAGNETRAAFATARGVRPAPGARRPEWLMLERGGHKVIADARSGTVRLYRPRVDPGERRDLASAEEATATELGRLAREQRRADRGLGRRLRREAAPETQPGTLTERDG